MKLQSFNSLSSKLLLLFLAFAVLFLFFVGNGIKNAAQNLYQNNGRPHIEQYLTYLRDDIGYPPNLEQAANLAKTLDIGIVIVDKENYWSSNNEVIQIDDIEAFDKLKDLSRHHKHHSKHNDADSLEDKLETQYEDGIPPQSLVEDSNQMYIGSYVNDKYFIAIRYQDTLYMFNTTKFDRERRGLNIFKPLIFLLILLIILFLFTRRLFAPIKKIQQGVKSFGEGNLNNKISIKRNDELGQLAKDANTMADNIQQMLDAKRELLLAVSHELRSPLTRSMVALEFLDQSDFKDQIKNDLQELELLISHILETERLNTNHHSLELGEYSIHNLIKNLLDEHFSQSNIQLDLSDDANCLLDNNRIKLLLKSLIDNALRYQRSAVIIHTKVDADKVTIEIIDDGEGIASEEISKLKQPFYRPDASRQRKTGAYGLGLYLADVIAKAHGGQLIIESELNKGTTVILELPLHTED